MLTLSATPALPVANGYARADASAAASTAAAQAHAQVRALEASNATVTLRQTGPLAASSSAMAGLTAVGIANAASGMTYAFGRLRDIAAAESDPALPEADRQALQEEYAQLSNQVASVVGTSTATENAGTSADKGHDHSTGHDQAAGGGAGKGGHGSAQPDGHGATPRAASGRALADTYGPQAMTSGNASGGDSSHSDPPAPPPAPISAGAQEDAMASFQQAATPANVGSGAGVLLVA